MSKKYNSSFYVYQLKNGAFFKHGKRGSFSVAHKPYTAKELSTLEVANAANFQQVSKDMLASNEPPYDAPFMTGGKWLKVRVTKTFHFEG